MKLLNKRYFILLAGLLFVTSVSSDSLLHKFSDNLAYEIECQLCINEIARNHSSFVKDEVPLPGRNYGIRFNYNF